MYIKSPSKKHGGKRKGAGRKPAQLPEFTKKFRASEDDQKKFMLYLTGNARIDFIMVMEALIAYRKDNDR